MLHYLLTFLLTIILVFVFFQDIKNRTIHLGLPILIFILAVFINYISPELSIKFVLYNIVFVCINIIGLILFLSLKNKAFFNPIDKSLGLGDIVFFIAITPLFDLKSFILFFILGLLFSLLLHSVFMRFKHIQTIPLAGYLSVFLILHVFSKTFFQINDLF